MDPLTVFLILAGCSAFLTGCGRQEEENEIFIVEAEPIPEKEIEDELGVEDEEGLANDSMQLKCTSGNDEIVKLKHTSGNSVQRGTEAVGIDVDMERFKRCNTSPDKKCNPEIEGDIWQCTDSSHTSNQCNTVKCTSFLFCKYGAGIIYVYDDGQKEGEMNAFGAFFIMEFWLEEGYSVVSEEQLASALENARNYGGQSQVKSFAPPVTDNDTKFDTSILAWTNFWNYKQRKVLGEGNYTPVRAEVVKCMVTQESTMGKKGVKNCQNDVMQSLFPGDFCFWGVTKYDPNIEGKSHMGENEQVIYVIDLEGETINGTLVKGYDTNDTDIYEWFEDGSWDIYSSILDESGEKEEYTYYYGRVTPDMSICAGVGYYAYKLNKESGRVTEAKGAMI